MELKVWCDGIQRVVCGVSAQTTCQDVVFALAHATAQTGRFILIERWRNSERLLAPSEHPLAVLSKWGEYANDVTFVMKRSEHHNKTNANAALNQSQSPHHSATASPLPIGSPPTGGGLSPNRRDLLNLINNNKSIYLSLNRKSGGLNQSSGSSSPSMTKPLTSTPITNQNNNSSNNSPNVSPLKSNSCPNSSHDNNTNSIANNKAAIDSAPNELNRHQMNNKNNNTIELTSTKSPPTAGNRPRHPPPYSEAIQQSALISTVGQTNTTTSSHLVPNTDVTNTSNKRRSAEPSPQSQKQKTSGQKDTILHRDAVRLVDMQKDTMKSQEKEMSSLEQQISAIEKRLLDNELLIKRYKDEMETCHQLWLDQEVLIDQLGDESQLEQELDQLVSAATNYEEEMAGLKKKLSQCETDIGECRQKITKLMDQLEESERLARDNALDREDKEREMVEQLRTAMREKNADLESQRTDLQKLTNNLKQLDSALNEKTSDVDRLLAEIKEANIQGLALQTAAETQKHNPSAGRPPFQHRTGSTRRIIGSPRELENAVATNKNPHGVWV